MKVVTRVARWIAGFIKLSPRRGASPHLLAVAVIAVSCGSVAIGADSPPSFADTPALPSSYIVQDGTGVGASPASNLVSAVGGQVEKSLSPISAVSADLTPAQLATIQTLPGVAVTPDVPVTVQSTLAPSPPTSGPVDAFAQQTGATSLWSKGDEGAGVNVAVLDTGIDPLTDFSNRLISGVDLSGEGNALQDSYGHGSFVAGLIAGNGASSAGQYTGEAPQAGLVSVKVAGVTGVTDLATVIAGVDWTIENAQALNIRVLNMSLGFVPFESTTVNPLDQAVEQAWNSGIVVVASAGNDGPFNGTILSPGDDPLIITAGAVEDMGSPTVSGDQMAPFSSVGPTFPDGWIKPDLVTSGRSVISLRAPGSVVDLENPTAEVGTSNFVGSGTSFSSAITAGAAALILSAHPNDTPNQVKAAMLATTNPGPTGSPFVDGHGVLNVASAAANNGVQLTQNFGDAFIESAGKQQISPGDTLEAGYAFSMAGSKQAATVQMLAATVAVPVSCSNNGTTAGWITVDLASGPYSVAPPIKGWTPASSPNSLSSFQGSTLAPDLCSGGAMYSSGAGFSSEVNSTDTTDNVQVQFHYMDTSGHGPASWSSTANVIPVSTALAGSTVNLQSTWATSSWNTANWKGLPPAPPGGPTGAAVIANGSAWNGSAWNGSAWNGSAWNGSAWNGSAWNGSAWNGSAWNGSAWNGSAWNGSAWNGSAWN